MADHDYTPEIVESDILVKAPIYYDEPGLKRAKVSKVTLVPCTQCGVDILEGKLDNGTLVIVEPEVATYSVLWVGGEAHPRLKPGRGYPQHVCRLAT